jgi:hypothetical protein
MNVVSCASASQKAALVALLFAGAMVGGCGGPRPSTVHVHALLAPIDEAKDPFFSAPWPDDRRRASDGSVSTLHFPNPSGSAHFATALRLGDHLLKGWGLSSPVYLPFSGALDPASFPTDPKATDGAVFLLDIDPSSPERGLRHPADFHFEAAPTLFLPGNILAVRPVPGFPLRAKTTYAAVVTTDVRDANGLRIEVARELTALSTWPALRGEMERNGLDPKRVAAATVFTTQPILDEIIVLRDYLLSASIPDEPVPDLHLVTGRPASEPFWLFEGHYLAPHLQHGTLPYASEGGDFQYDANGQTVPDFQESMRVAVVVPKGAPPPGGFPFSLYSHGTGGYFESIVTERNSVGLSLAKKGVAGFGIDQVLAGPRAGTSGGSCFFQSVEYCFTDYVNPIAGRNNLRQAALDNVFLRRVAQHLTIPADVHPEGFAVTFDQRRFGFVGHSQGGITGAIYTAIDPELWGSVLSGAGGLTTGSILERKIPDAKALIEGPFFLDIAGKESLDWYHPALALEQMLNEAVDPVSYAPYWLRSPQGRAKNIYATSGLVDQYIWPDTAEFMIAAARIPRYAPVARASLILDLTGLPAVVAPVTGNVAGATAVFRQFERDGHFAIFDDPIAYKQWPEFMRSMLVDGVATVPAD